MLGKIDIGAAVGTESMTNTPYLLMKARKGYRMGDGELIDSLLYNALKCGLVKDHMGVTAENVAKMYNISREEQDELAVLSHTRAIKAIAEGKFKDEIVPVEIVSKKGTKIFDTDEHARADVTMESLAKLRPAFVKDGTVTAGNASGVNDGAAALILMAADKAKELGAKPIARVVATAMAGVEPRVMGIGVVPAVEKALKYAGLSKDDIGYWELNEAFAVQVVYCRDHLRIDPAKLNPNGGSISIGHPFGMSGSRMVGTMANEMKRRKARYVVVTMCIGGGQGAAGLFELAS
jgi:acetyl-CoA C-acetyltransferase